MDSAGSRSDWISGAAAVAAGVGMLVMALFPLAIPILVLAIAVMLPLVLPLVALALIAAILVGAWRMIRAVVRGIRRLGGGRGRAGVSPAEAHLSGRASLPGRPGGAESTGPRPRLSDEGV